MGVFGYKWPLVLFPSHDFHMCYIPPALGEHVCPLKELFLTLHFQAGALFVSRCYPPQSAEE